ncbi:ALG6, ALG8 glycosyltransferase [Linderina pennispora]|uniref:Alpha-1,3-glucosyltransferase n=1 Tax=Linderina pennispora TaxID=61395 RepID=A0A1Y1WME5_9FUNG|nr:ALG6, ALG8 glycosyltransferase [Linderina pennispora]ORX74683.1 ALG6, ALG8 glycosyltransferase [Linderina pennispora]
MKQWFQFLEEQDAQGIALPTTLLFSLLACHPCSADYEAQRHWMEITTHLAPSEWYFYDLQYWGLDYPPLTAFQSWLCGAVANLIDPSWVALLQSRGIETAESKMFMRASVIAFEFAIYVPAVVVLFMSRHQKVSRCLSKPCLTLIDNGHFQYNSVMLGLLVWSVCFAMQGRYVAMAIAFSCSLLFKQMALYYAPAVFFYLLAKCFQRRHGLALFIKLGVAVVATFAVVLSPWITSPDQLMQILVRVFPDKVANIWCAVNVAVKLRANCNAGYGYRLSCHHVCICLSASDGCNLTARLPTQRRLLSYALVNSSLAFFLLSFQVHEKSILLPLAPALLLINDEPWAVDWFVQIALFSMYPLLFKDGLQIPYWVMAVGWAFLRSCPACPSDKARVPLLVMALQWISWAVMAGLHIANAYVPPPSALPDLYAVLNVLFSCAMFVLFLVYFNYRQFTALVAATEAKDRVKVTFRELE